MEQAGKEGHLLLCCHSSATLLRCSRAALLTRTETPALAPPILVPPPLGAGEGFGVLIADAQEAWYIETAGGHGWLAQRVPDDKFFVSANQGRFGVSCACSFALARLLLLPLPLPAGWADVGQPCVGVRATSSVKAVSPHPFSHPHNHPLVSVSLSGGGPE